MSEIKLQERLREQPPLTCPHIDRFLSAANAPQELKDELEAIKNINSQLRYGLFHERARADTAEAEIARLKNFLQFLKTPLQEIDGLFGDIRNDWTDPRHECRSGRESVAIVEAMIEELLRTKDAG